MIPIVIVIVVALTIHTSVGDSHFHRTIQAEGHDRIAGYSYRSPARLCAIDCADNRAHNTVVTQCNPCAGDVLMTGKPDLGLTLDPKWKI